MNRRLPLSHIYWASRKCHMKHKDILPWLLLLFTCSQGFQVSNDKLLKATHIRMVTLATESNQPQKHFSMTAALSVISRNSLTKEENWHIEPKQGRNTYNFDTNKCCSSMCSKILLGREIFTAQKSTLVARGCLIFHHALSAHNVEASVGLPESLTKLFRSHFIGTQMIFWNGFQSTRKLLVKCSMNAFEINWCRDDAERSKLKSLISSVKWMWRTRQVRSLPSSSYLFKHTTGTFPAPLICDIEFRLMAFWESSL